MTKLFVNEKVWDAEGATLSRAPLDFHRKLPNYEETPLVSVPSLAWSLGIGSLWVKDESSRMGLPSFKILGASWGVYRALEERFGPLGDFDSIDELKALLEQQGPIALTAATDGNHGRAVARMAKLLGLEARIFVPTGTAPARIDAIETEGASCDVVKGTYDAAVARSAKEAGDRCLVISDTSWPGYESVPAWVIEGYSTIFWEIEDALASRRAGVDLVVIQMGVGALAAAAARHYRTLEASRVALLGIEPKSAACILASLEAREIVSVPGPHDSIMVGLNCDSPSVVAWPAVSAGYDVILAIEDARAEEGMRALANEHIVAGETGAAGIGGLLEVILGDHSAELRDVLGIMPRTRVLAICTEGATDPKNYERIVGSPPRA